MNLTAYVESPSHVCCRYRLRAIQPLLTAAGHSLELQPHPKFRWYRPFFQLPRCEAVVVQRRLPSALELGRIRSAAKSLIFDFDDAVWLRDSYAAKGLHSPRRERRFQNMIAAADRVVAGNDFLANAAARFVDSSRVYVVPTCVDNTRYAVAEHNDKCPVDLVWIGSSSTLHGLERIRPILDAIGKSAPNVRLKLVCDRFFSLQSMPVIARPWHDASEADELASASVGIAWMPDDDWSRGKCGLKVLQYMATGLPVIANPVGVHLEMIEHGKTGFLAESEQEWVEAVRLLANDAELRRRMGAAGRERVERVYSIARAGADWLQLLDGMRSQRVAA